MKTKYTSMCIALRREAERHNGRDEYGSWVQSGTQVKVNAVIGTPVALPRENRKP